MRVDIESAHVARMERRLGAIKIRQRSTQTPVDARAPQRAPRQRTIDCVKAHAGQMQHAHLRHVHHRGARRHGGPGEALKAIRGSRRNKAAVGMRERQITEHFRTGGLGQVFIEGQAVGVGGKIFHRSGKPRVVGKVSASVGKNVGASLVHPQRSGLAWYRLVHSPVQQAVPSDGDRVQTSPAPAEIAVRREASFAPVLGSQGQIHAAVDHPVHLLPQDDALHAGVGKDREQEARLAACFIQRPAQKRQVEHRHVQQLKAAVARGGLVVRHFDRMGNELPVGFRQPAGGHGAIDDAVAALPGLQQYAPGKDERVRRAVDHGLAQPPHAERAGHIVELGGVIFEVHLPASGRDLGIVRPAHDLEMAIRFDRG